MKITKYIHWTYIMASAMLLASCADEEFVGDKSLLDTSGSDAITLNMKTPAVTRTDKTGGAAADDLKRNFVLFGYKTMPSPATSPQTVFDNYQVNYTENTAKTTTTNSSNWEYVGFKRLTADMTDNKGVAVNAENAANAADAEQTIKYWDFSATNYKFFAYSLGKGKLSGTSYANASLMTNETNEHYTLIGDKEQLGTCYISELKTIVPNISHLEVNLRFLSFLSKIQLGFYETIPGYSVKSLSFYLGNGAASEVPNLYASSEILPKAGKYTITFNSDGKPQIAWDAEYEAKAIQQDVTFGAIPTTTGNYADRDYREDDVENTYIGRASNTATKTNVIEMLPYNVGADLTLKVDYVLVSRDGSGETIEAKGATAKVPAAYTQWKPNSKYTYLFKISDNTNPLIGTITGLYPITLDAVVTDTEDGSQETITTVSEPSITTYAKGAINEEYVTGSNIYVAVEDGATNTALTVGTNAKLYFVTIESGAAQDITETSVANAITPSNYQDVDKSWTVTDALGKKMVITDTESNLLEAITTIPSADSPTGANLTINCAKFEPKPEYEKITTGSLTNGDTYYTLDGSVYTPYTANGLEDITASDYYEMTATGAGYYAFEYVKETASYKAATGKYVSGTTYYTDTTGETEVDTTGFEDGVTDVSSYYVVDIPAGSKFYKVIKVVTAP